ncbi:MAG: hypothetical protein HOP12_08725, partial [Candidatus Eisenbacteria bacterium]|nr:hypothetical protein [Candidatus Eisenbacteria bacterium]
LEAAASGGLTAEAVKKQFGVTPVTYYSWRKKYGVGRKRRGRRAATAAPARASGGLDLGSIGAQVRSTVQARVREMVQGIVRLEVESYVASLFGGKRRGRPPGKRLGRPPKKK